MRARDSSGCLTQPRTELFGLLRFRARITTTIRRERIRHALLAGAVLVALTLPAAAQDATWLLNPGSSDFNTATNWTPATVPTGTATFDNSNTTNLSFSTGTIIGGWTFDVGASDYTFDVAGSVTFTGAGIAINGGSATITSDTLVFGNTSTAGRASITNDDFLKFFNSSSAGNATITNNHTVIFDDTSTAGSAAITNNDALIFRHSSTAGSATITNNGSLAFSDASTADNAAITNNAGGTVDFSATTGPAGDGKLSAGSIAGAGSFFLGADEVTVGGNDTSTTVSGVISDGGGAGGSGGSLVKVGTGTLTLSGANTYTGATTINSGTLKGGAANAFSLASAHTVAAGGTLDLGGFDQTIGSLAGAGTVTNNGAAAATLTVGSDNTDTTFSGVIKDGAKATALTKTGAGILTLTGANTYTGGTTIVGASTLQLGDAVNTGAIVGDVIVDAGGLFSIVNADPSGITSIVNAGSTTFENTSTAGSANIINNHVIDFFRTSTAGSASITNNFELDFVDNSTAGAAAITNNAGGSVDFSLDVGPAGDNKLSAGSIAGAGVFYLGANELTVGSNNLSSTMSGVISDCGRGSDCLSAGATGGSLVKIGTGTLTFSGANIYTGPTAINGGTLMVNGSIASPLTTVNAGGILGGGGTVQGVTVNSGGIFAPGSGTAGTSTTVNGALTFASGGIYRVQVSPTTASFANATTATLTGGSVQVVLDPGTYMKRQYTILHTAAAGGFGGTQFAGVTGPSNVVLDLSYSNDQDVLLDLTARLGLNGGLNGTQQNAGGAIDDFFNAGGTLPPQFTSLFGLSGSDLANALTQISGEDATGAQQGAFQLGGQFLGIMLDPFVDGRGGANSTDGGALSFASESHAVLPDDVARAYAKAVPSLPTKAPSFDRRWSVWGSAYGGTNKTSGDPAAGSHDLDAHAVGFAAGLDYRFTPATTLGFALAGGGTGWDLADGLGTGKSDAFQAGLYGVTHNGPAYIGAALAFTNYWMSTDRTAFAGDHLTADFNAQSYGARLEGGWRFALPAAAVTPYAAVQAQSFHTPSYAETDVSGGGFALSYDANTATATRAELGARFDRLILARADAVLSLYGKLAWAHDWTSDPSVNATFQALPDSSFIVNGAEPASDLALVSAGAKLQLAHGVSLIGKFDGEFASGSQTYAGTGTLRVSW